MKYLKKYNEEIEWDWLDEEEYPIPDDFKGNEDFYNFLKDNNVLEKWIDNFNKQKKWRVDQGFRADIIKYLKSQTKYNFFMNCFHWVETPGGDWEELNDKWRIKVLKYNENIEWNWVQEEEYPNSIPDDFKGNEDFYNFLKENDALEKWISNINNIGSNVRSVKDFFFQTNEDEHRYRFDFINHSFFWSSTPEGQLFWEELDSEWRRNLNKQFENINWNWLDEEEDPYSIIDTNKLTKDEYDQLLKKLKIGDRYIFDYINYKNLKGEIKYLRGITIGIEFDEKISPGGHSGGDNYNGKPGHCWNFSYYNNYNLIIKEKLN